MQAKQIHTSWNPKRILYSKKMAPYIFVAPFIASFLIFFLYPSIETIRMSFMSMEGFGKERFVGFHNYVRLLITILAMQSSRIPSILAVCW